MKNDDFNLDRAFNSDDFLLVNQTISAQGGAFVGRSRTGPCLAAPPANAGVISRGKKGHFER